jgi:hypothetical protein
MINVSDWGSFHGALIRRYLDQAYVVVSLGSPRLGMLSVCSCTPYTCQVPRAFTSQLREQ